MICWRLAMLAQVLSCLAPLAAQSAPKWEYGRLYARRGVPMIWIVGTTTTPVDSGMAVYGRITRAELQIMRGSTPPTPAENELTPATLLLSTMNRLGVEGWELVAIIPSPPIFSTPPANPWEEVEYFFKRPKR